MSVVGVREQNTRESCFEPKWHKIAILTGKVLLVAIAIAALAAATYFTAGAALMFAAKGSALLTSLTTIGAGTLGIATLAVPIAAGAYKMYKVTKENIKDILRFAAFLLAITIIGYLAYTLRHYYL